MKVFDAAIVGAGIIGTSIAFELASEKLHVILLDRAQPGAEASSAAAGMLAPGPESAQDFSLVPLSKESFRLYPDFVATVQEVSGLSVDYEPRGTIQVFPGPQGERMREEMTRRYRELDLPIELIPPGTVREVEAAIGPATRFGAFLPGEATLDPRLLVSAALEAARRKGVEIRAQCEATSILRDGGRCAGIAARDERILARNVVIAAGCFSAGIGGVCLSAAVRPVRGQMLALRSGKVRLRHVVRSESGYLVPRPDGRIILGSTLEDVGFAKHVTPGGLSRILAAAQALVPGIEDAEILEMWAGLRPGTTDNLPILGPTETQGLWMATGHYRNGILLAPVTAKLLRDWIVSGNAPGLAAPFSPLRFTQSGRIKETQDSSVSAS